MSSAKSDTEHDLIDVCVIEDHLDYRKTLMAELQDSAELTCRSGFSSVETALESIDGGYVPDVVLLDIAPPLTDRRLGTPGSENQPHVCWDVLRRVEEALVASGVSPVITPARRLQAPADFAQCSKIAT
ncbi:MAG: hypothetical protein ACI9MB_001398 [Verrucomicrobiales bacterium]|jgi:hypothetical protein